MPPAPEELLYLFVWWRDELVGFERLTYAEMLAWAKVTKKDLMGWEANVLITLDGLFWNIRDGVKEQ